MTSAGSLADPEQVRALLIAAAASGHPLTYSETLNRLGHAFSRPKMRALCKVLEAVDRQSAERGEPELAVLVVRQSDGLPGQGWWVGCAGTHGHTGDWTGPEAQRLVRKLQRAAFDHWKDRG